MWAAVVFLVECAGRPQPSKVNHLFKKGGPTRLDVAVVLYLHDHESHVIALWESVGKGGYFV